MGRGEGGIHSSYYFFVHVIRIAFARFLTRLRQLRRGRLFPSHHRDIELLRRIHNSRFPRWQQIKHVHRLLTRQERRIIRVCAVIGCIGFLWIGTEFVQAHREAVPTVGGRYIEGVVGAPQLINPIFASLNDVDVDLTRLMYSGLLRYDENQRLVPDIALRYYLAEDKKTYTFFLRQDVTWHDGEPVTAKDVVFTIERIQNSVVNSPLLVSFQGVAVKALDDYTVQFILPEPFAPFLSTLVVGIVPEHIWFDVPPERMHLHKNNLQPVGSGPFVFSKLAKDDTGYIYRYELKRYANFYDQPPYIEELVFRFFAEYDGPAGVIQAVREQRVDGLNFVPKDLRDRVERKHISLRTLQLPQYTSLFLNRDHESALKDKDVRVALAHALDKDRLVREVIKGEGYVIHSPILPGFPGYTPEAPRVDYDPGKATELLNKTWPRISADEYRALRKDVLVKERLVAASSTVTLGGEGESSTSTTLETVTIEGVTSTLAEAADVAVEHELDQELNKTQTFYRKNKDGEVLAISLVTADTQEYKKAAELIAGFWEEIGIKTDIEFIPPKNITRTALKDRRYDVLLYGVIIGSDPDQYPFWHSSQVDFPGLNLSRYVNRAADTLLEQTRETTDEEKIIELYQKFQELILDDRPAVFLYTPTYTYAISQKVKGVDVVRIFHPADRLANITQWYIETKGQWRF